MVFCAVQSGDANLPEGQARGLLAQREEDQEVELPGIRGHVQVLAGPYVYLWLTHLLILERL